MELNAYIFGTNTQKIFSQFVVCVTAIFLSSFFYSKQLYKITFYILAILGFYVAFKRIVILLKGNHTYPWKKFWVLSGILFVWFLYLIFSVGGDSALSHSGAFFVLYFILFLFLCLSEDRHTQMLYFVFLLIPVLALLSADNSGMSSAAFKDMGSKYSKYLLIASLVPLYRSTGIKNSQIIGLICLASIFLGVMALLDYWRIDVIRSWFFEERVNWAGRAAGNSTPARFGTVAASLFCIALAYLSINENHMRFQKILLLLAMCFSLIALLLAQSRGPWFAVIVFVVLMLCFSKNLGNKLKITLFIISILAVGLIYQLDFVKHRVQKTLVSVESYMQAENHLDNGRRSAVGIRIELWRASYGMFTKSPLLGVGGGNFKYELSEIVNTGEYHPHTLKYHSAHNQIMAALSERGLLGFVATILFFVVCFISFTRKTNKAEKGIMRSGVYGGIAIVVIYAFAGITHETLDQKYLLMFYLVCISLFYAVIHAQDH